MCAYQGAPLRFIDPILTRTSAISVDNDVYVTAAALDPKYSFIWLQNHPGNQENTDQLQSSISGMLYFLATRVDVFCRVGTSHGAG